MLQSVNSVYYSIRKHKLIKAEKKLLAAISGGQDSICLVLILYLLQTQIQYVFDLIWFNHFWQKSSFFTMLHVSRCSYSLSSRITLWLPLTDVFSEQSARDWRHGATQRAYVFYQYDLCVQGHSKSDRTETVLFNLIRGTGMSGISALHRTNSQVWLYTNNCYPMCFQLMKQTHWITVGVNTLSTTCFSTFKLVNRNSADMGFAKISPNRYRLIYLADALHGINWVYSATLTLQRPILKKASGKKKITFPHNPTLHFYHLQKGLSFDRFTAGYATRPREASRCNVVHDITQACYVNASVGRLRMKTTIGSRICHILAKTQKEPLAYLCESSTEKVQSQVSDCSTSHCFYNRLKRYAVSQTYKSGWRL